MKRLFTILLALSLLSVPVYVHAQLQNPGGGGGGGNVQPGGGGIVNPLGANRSFADILVGLSQWLLGLVAILALIGVVMSGIRMVLAIGNEQGIATAKKILMWSVAGLVVSALALTIISIVATELLGVSQAPPLGITSVYAQGGNVIGLDKAQQTGLEEFGQLEIAGNILNFITSLAAIIALLVFIIGAVMYIISLGDESKAAFAKRIMLYAIVGLLLVGGAYVVIRLVRDILDGSAGS